MRNFTWAWLNLEALKWVAENFDDCDGGAGFFGDCFETAKKNIFVDETCRKHRCSKGLEQGFSK